MKTFYILILAGAFLLISFYNLYSQPIVWNYSKRITSGFIDKNPAFDTKNNYSTGIMGKTFLVFERNYTTMYSDICIMKFTSDSAFTNNVTFLTNGSTINHNPKISWNTPTYTDSLRIALAVWERTENSRVNIYGCTFNNNTGQWSAPFPVDTGSGIKAHPQVLFDNGDIFNLVYENNSDIIFKQINANTHAVSNEINLTSSDSSECIRPCVLKGMLNPQYIVCYQRKKTNGEYAIYYKKASSSFDWSGDSVSTSGNNINPQFTASTVGDHTLTFESNRQGIYKIYNWNYGYSVMMISFYTNYALSNYQNFIFPIITKLQGLFNAVLAQTNNSMKIMFGYYTGSINDSVTVSDTTHKPVVTMGNGITLPPPYTYLQMVWTVYNKDSAGYSMLYALGKKISITSVQLAGTEIPVSFILHQNYPNPFNPVTKIKFDIPVSSFVTLRIYDASGREIASLVNENLDAGSYQTEWSASGMSSGVYFYTLTSDNYRSTKSMILIK